MPRGAGGLILGAAGRLTWRPRSTDRPGCEWTGCWESMACSRRRRRGGRSLSGGWRRAGWRRRTRRPGRGFAGAGVWAARSSSARCWRKWKAGAASPIRASCAASRPKRRRSALLAKNSAAWGGVGPNWPPGTRVIPASWRWRHGCARRQRTRARVLPPGCIWVTSKRANARQHQFMVPPPPSDPRQSQLRL